MAKWALGLALLLLSSDYALAGSSNEAIIHQVRLPDVSHNQESNR